MIEDQNLENQLNRQDRRLKELTVEIESLDREIEELMAPLAMTKNQVDAYLGNKEHFTDEEWATLENIKSDLELKLAKIGSQKSNPQKLKDAYQELNVSRHWLFVR